MGRPEDPVEELRRLRKENYELKERVAALEREREKERPRSRRGSRT